MTLVLAPGEEAGGEAVAEALAKMKHRNVLSYLKVGPTPPPPPPPFRILAERGAALLGPAPKQPARAQSQSWARALDRR